MDEILSLGFVGRILEIYQREICEITSTIGSWTGNCLTILSFRMMRLLSSGKHYWSLSKLFLVRISLGTGISPRIKSTPSDEVRKIYISSVGLNTLTAFLERQNASRSSAI